MKPVRIRKRIILDDGGLMLLRMMIFIPLGILLGSCSFGSFDWEIRFILDVVAGSSLFAFYPYFIPPLWVEFGDRLTYCTLLGVHTHEWSDIKAIQFRHEVHWKDPLFPEEAEEGDGFYVLSTELVITFANEKRIRLTNIASLWSGTYPRRFEEVTYPKRFDEVREEIVQTLVDGLRDNEICTRRRATEALARFSPDAVVYLPNPAKEQGEDFTQAAAEAQRRADAFKVVLREAVPYLNELMQDPDDNVREAATEVLCRTAHPSHEPRTIGEPGTRILCRNKPTEWRCPSCGETAPNNFDLCWNCQRLRSETCEVPDECPRNFRSARQRGPDR